MEAKIEAIMKAYIDILTHNTPWTINIEDELRKILTKHLQPSKSVEELIEKWREPLLNNENLLGWVELIKIFLQDLQDLLPEEKEEVVEIRWKWCWLWRCKCGEDIEEYFNYCWNCWKKIKRVE